MIEQATKPGRIVVVETVYHQQQDAAPVSVVSRYSADLETDEQPYTRVFKLEAGGAWKKLETGWLSSSRCVSIAVQAIKRQAKPSKDQLALDEKKMLEISVAEREGGSRGADLLVAPSESTRFRPASLASVYLRCQEGPIRVSVTVFPS